jgi:RNA polymerase sigma factor (sigma-70 family)
MEPGEVKNPWTSLILLERYRDGDESAATELFHRYFQRLTSLARKQLSARVAQRVDPEDIVLSVYRSFFVEAQAGRYVLGRGGDLWRLLSSIATHKLLKQVRHEKAARRSILAEVPLDSAILGRVENREIPLPEDAIALTDELEQVFSSLDSLSKRVLELRLQGLSLAEIAADTYRSERTVRRSLAFIRKVLSDRLNHA